MIVTIIAALVALVIGGAAGYFIFRYGVSYTHLRAHET